MAHRRSREISSGIPRRPFEGAGPAIKRPPAALRSHRADGAWSADAEPIEVALLLGRRPRHAAKHAQAGANVELETARQRPHLTCATTARGSRSLRGPDSRAHDRGRRWAEHRDQEPVGEGT